MIYVAAHPKWLYSSHTGRTVEEVRGLEIPECPFVNLPEPRGGRWGQGLTAAKMKECIWLKSKLVAQIEFLEWAGENRLRHSKFGGLRADKVAKDVHRE